MTERLDLKTLEPFRNPLYPFLYMVDDKMAIKTVLKSLPQRYAVETGFGEEPTRVFHIDSSLPWILTEPRDLEFSSFKRNIQYLWKDINVRSLYVPNPLIALKTNSTNALEYNAKVVVYRNLDYRDMYIIPHNQLKKGQRLVFIVDMLHADGDEWPKYHHLLRKAGYDPNLLQVRSHDLPELTQPVPFAQDDYVLDVVN